MVLAEFWAIVSQAHLDTLSPSRADIIEILRAILEEAGLKKQKENVHPFSHPQGV
jgi:hypothetical protein